MFHLLHNRQEMITLVFVMVLFLIQFLCRSRLNISDFCLKLVSKKKQKKQFYKKTATIALTFLSPLYSFLEEHWNSCTRFSRSISFSTAARKECSGTLPAVLIFKLIKFYPNPAEMQFAILNTEPLSLCHRRRSLFSASQRLYLLGMRLHAHRQPALPYRNSKLRAIPDEPDSCVCQIFLPCCIFGKHKAHGIVADLTRVYYSDCDGLV